MTQNCYHFVILNPRFSPLGRETVEPWMKGIHRKGLKMATIQKIHQHKYRVVRGLSKDGQVQFVCDICKERS
jgi:hypothetical protein